LLLSVVSQKKWRSGFKGSGFKPALVRRDVAMKLFSDSMGGFPSPHLDMPGLGQGFHSRPWTGFGMRIYEKSVSFVRPNPKFEAKLAIIWEMSIFNENFGSSMPFIVLNPER
jgi:hypothetical protein